MLQKTLSIMVSVTIATTLTTAHAFWGNNPNHNSYGNGYGNNYANGNYIQSSTKILASPIRPVFTYPSMNDFYKFQEEQLKAFQKMQVEQLINMQIKLSE